MVHLMSRRARCFIALAALVGVAAFLPGWTSAYGDSAQVSNLFQQARTSATQLKNDSVLMESYTSSQLSWESHARQINQIKEHINRSGEILSELHNAREGAEPWQQDTIDRITPLLEELASNTTSIIDHLNDRKQTWHPEYTGYLKDNAEVAADLSKLINDSIDYGRAKARVGNLEKSLGFTGS